MRPEDPGLGDLRRALAADPQNEELALRLRNLTRRIFGAEARRILGDREAWAAAEDGPQDAAAYAVAEALAPDFSLLGLQAYPCAGLSHRIARFRHESSGIALHLLPGGAALIGSEDGPENERPQQRVVVPPFLMGRFPVLQSEWDRVLAHRPPRRRFLGRFLRRREPEAIEDRRLFDGPDLPIHHLMLADVDRWLALLEGELRLPSEAEWEYAARAGSDTEYFWGDRPDHSYFWHGFNSQHHAHAPQEHAAKTNAFGLVDMLGNVLECCADSYRSDYSDSLVGAEPRDLWRAESIRVVRGGSFRHDSASARCADRRSVMDGDRAPELGLRVARSLPEGLFESPEKPEQR